MKRPEKQSGRIRRREREMFERLGRDLKRGMLRLGLFDVERVGRSDK
jgi:hypothetical protein